MIKKVRVSVPIIYLHTMVGRGRGRSTPRPRRQIRQLLPLLQVLKSMKPADRIIMMSHLSNEAKDVLFKTVTHVMSSNNLSGGRRRLLKSKLAPYKNILTYFTSSRSTPAGRRKRVVQLGGSPMNYILGAALPLFVNLFAK